jgi:hypothetical protein
MPNRKNKATTASLSTTYYVSRVIQRVSLLAAAASSMVLWASLVAVAHTTSLYASSNLYNLDDISRGASHEINILKGLAVTLSLVAVMLSLLLVSLPRIYKYEKRLIVDGVTIGAFFFVISVWCEPIYRMILSYY